MRKNSQTGLVNEDGKGPQVNQLVEAIGQEASDLSQEGSGKILVYADIEERAISVSLFFADREGGVQYRPASSQALGSAVYSFWEFCREEPGYREWQEMSFVLEGKKFKIHLTYPDQIDKEEQPIKRRGRVIEEHFGNVKIDYPKPPGATN